MKIFFIELNSSWEAILFYYCNPLFLFWLTKLNSPLNIIEGTYETLYACRLWRVFVILSVCIKIFLSIESLKSSIDYIIERLLEDIIATYSKFLELRLIFKAAKQLGSSDIEFFIWTFSNLCLTSANAFDTPWDLFANKFKGKWANLILGYCWT